MNNHHINKKGASVSRSQRTAKSTTQPKAGFFASLSSLLRSKGTSAPSSRRFRATLATLALAIAGFALSAAPAFAAPPTVTTPVVSEVSYTTTHVSSNVDPKGGLAFYAFEVSTDDGASWTPNPGAGGIFFEKETLQATLTELESGTEYAVRLKAQVSFPEAFEVISPGPDPSFTTLTADPPTIPGEVGTSTVFSTSATATGEVRRPSNSDEVTCEFEYVSDEDFAESGFDTATSRPCIENPIGAADAETDKEVTAQLGCPNPVLEDPEGKCLKPETTYHLRLTAGNAAPGVVTKDATSTFTTTAKVAAPAALAADQATEVGKRSAKASGEVERPAGADPALDVSCRFEYVTDSDFAATGFENAGQAPCAQTVSSSEPDYPAVSAEVNAELSELEPGTTYHLRLTAENGGGTDAMVAANTFTTLELILPSFTADPASEIGYTSVRLSGTADPGNEGTFPVVEVAPAGTEEWYGTLGGQLEYLEPSAPAEHLFVDFPCKYGPGCAQPLKPGTTYQFRLGGSIGPSVLSFVYSASPYPEFTTKGTSTLPSATFDPITDFTATSAHFSATVDTHAPAGPLPEEGKAPYETDWHFECTPACPGPGLAGTVSAEEGSKALSVDAIRLDPNTPYEVKLVVENALGTVETPVQGFQTPLIAPTISPLPGASDGTGGYTIAGTVNPNKSQVTACEFKWGPTAPAYAFSAPCSPTPGSGPKPVTVEAHLPGLTPGVAYHFQLIATNAGGQSKSDDQSFKPELAPRAQECPNETEREENNSGSLPECRAYELVTYPNKEGYETNLLDFDGGEAVAYESRAPNLANSGAGVIGSGYMAARTEQGWEIARDLNGPTGSVNSGPQGFVPAFGVPYYSADLMTTLWRGHQTGGPSGDNTYLRRPDGKFVLVGLGADSVPAGVSDDLSHVVYAGSGPFGFIFGPQLGPGVYEFVGTGNSQPRRVDLDNLGDPVAECHVSGTGIEIYDAKSNFVSADGRVIVFKAFGGCGGANPPSNELWARIDGTASIDVSASQCHRLDCNALADPTFAGAAKDGSRVYFTTAQQLVDGDQDQTRDLYACDIPAGAISPAGQANHCAALRWVSGPESGAEIESVLGVSDDGSTAYFTARGVLAANEDSLGETALSGDRNLYSWRSDSADPAGQIAFVARLADDDAPRVQLTPDGKFMLLETGTPILPNDTDGAIDVYRANTVSRALSRVSTAVSGAGGNVEGVDAKVGRVIRLGAEMIDTAHNSHPSISDDGRRVVFITEEALSPLDGNGAPDAYLWNDGIPRGSLGPASTALIDGSGEDIYIQTEARLNPEDGDEGADSYDVRIGGGFSRPGPGCLGDACKSDPTPIPPAQGQASERQGPGNPPARKGCPKGKVNRKGKCVKKKKKGKHHRASRGKAGRDRGVSK